MITRHQAAGNRAAAQLAGTRTFQGTPCRAAGHPGERYTSTGACVACMAARYQATRAAPEPVSDGRAISGQAVSFSQLAVDLIL